MKRCLNIVLYSFLEGTEDIRFEANSWELTEHQTKWYVIWAGTNWTLGKLKSNALGFQSRKAQPPLAMCVLLYSSGNVQNMHCMTGSVPAPITLMCIHTHTWKSYFLYICVSLAWIMKLLLVYQWHAESNTKNIKTRKVLSAKWLLYQYAKKLFFPLIISSLAL